MKHRLDKQQRTVWHRLRDAGIVIILVMLMGLIALAIGVGVGTRIFG